MPHLPALAGHGQEDTLLQEMVDKEPPHKLSRRQSLMKSIGGMWKRHHEQPDTTLSQSMVLGQSEQSGAIPLPRSSSIPEHLGSKKAIPSLPRDQTVKRQRSEQRVHLLEVPQRQYQKRALSADQHCSPKVDAARRGRSPGPSLPIRSFSALSITRPDHDTGLGLFDDREHADRHQDLDDVPSELGVNNNEVPILLEDDAVCDEDDDEIDRAALQEEYDRRWVLNLSMHFRDKSNREKFFITYAEEPNKWRRITISVDYRNAPPESLEADLTSLHYQRDKSFRIYEAVHESLPDIQYYDTVTNLRLETTPDDNQLHVHVREDSNEIIQYPEIRLVDHVRCPRYRESDLSFDSHLSGFVYKVRIDGKLVIKKEIPGPDTVDEFLYEVNALEALIGCNNVTQLQGIITDDKQTVVKGLLISYASRGALVDMLFDYGGELEWHRREKWAKQIVGGLANIHEAGFVQGDFTLSNIVIDANDDAKIIDINRRGCPVGWEPPELGRLIDSGQRIGMHIGVKTDLYQLGMVLWALAEEMDEPERQRPLPPLSHAIPDYFRKIVDICLDERPQGRTSAIRLLRMFPRHAGESRVERPAIVDFDFPDLLDSVPSVSTSTHRSDKEYIDPELAVTIDEVHNEQQRRRADTGTSHFTSGQVTYVNPDSDPASSYRFESSGSWIVGRRGRSPVSSRRRRSSPCNRTATSATSLSLSPERGESKSVRNYVNDEEDEDEESHPCPAERDTQDLPCCKQGREQSQSPAIVDRRLVGVLQKHAHHFAPPLHQDSGFDEQMIEELRLEDTTIPQREMLEDLHLEDTLASQQETLGDDPRIKVGSVCMPSHMNGSSASVKAEIEPSHNDISNEDGTNNRANATPSHNDMCHDETNILHDHDNEQIDPLDTMSKSLLPPELPTPDSFQTAADSLFADDHALHGVREATSKEEHEHGHEAAAAACSNATRQ